MVIVWDESILMVKRACIRYRLYICSPKSVSIMALAAKDERLIKAHEKAVNYTLSVMEKEHIQVR